MNLEPNSSPNSTTADVAIVGMAARFPGAKSAEEFWDNLCRGVESIRTFSREELERAGVARSLLDRPEYVRAGAPLDEIESFDAAFFGISAKDAAIMDPQQRHFLECAWAALEDAGYRPDQIGGPIGVFAGSGPNSYLIHNLLTDKGLVENEGLFVLRHTGNDKDTLATRVSYQMNLHGPSVNVQTACSTSLVAVHMASQSLLSRECDMALAGAVTIELPHATGYLYRDGEILSRDGHCRAFDERSSGTVFGSGAAVVVLRRLEDALACGDTICAVIKGSAINNDGSRKVGYFAPSVEGQIDVISEALAVAGVAPESVDYVETHGTGTAVGDPIELAALGHVFRGRRRPLKIGSVKTNIGHLDTAAGMAGLIKTALAIRYSIIPPTLHFSRPNSRIDFAKARLEVADHLVAWPADGGPRRACVTSLGIGGTNAHIVLEQPPSVTSQKSARPARLLTLSAKTHDALNRASIDLARFLKRHSGVDLDSTAYTLHVGRKSFPHRRAVVCSDAEAAVSALEKKVGVAEDQTSAQITSIVFLFTGQGAQYVNMARGLYEKEPVFRQWIDTCSELAKPHLGVDFRTILYPSPEHVAAATSSLRETWNTQPVLFAVEYALAQLWMSWGVQPTRLLGHSIGEYVAATLAGVFSLEDAVEIVAKRGLLMRELSPGAMLAVQAAETSLGTLDPAVSLAAVNSPEQCVVAGPVEAIEALKQKFERQGIAVRRLQTSHAFHSQMMDPVVERFAELVAHKRLNPSKLRLVSNVTGTWMTANQATDPQYWAAHLRQTVRFADGVRTLLEEPGQLLIEVGPGDTLISLVNEQMENSQSRCLASLPRNADAKDDSATMLRALGRLWVLGAVVDWEGFHRHERLRRIPLPTYSFERRRFWLGPANGPTIAAEAARKPEDWFYRTSLKRKELRPTSTRATSWLILADALGAGKRLASMLREKGAEVATVVAGHGFAQTSGDEFVIDPISVKDFASVIASHRQPRNVVVLWTIDEASSMQAYHRHFLSLLAVVQALGSSGMDHPTSLCVMTNGALAAGDARLRNPGAAVVAGVCRVAPKEYADLFCIHVDVDTFDTEKIAEIALAETVAMQDSTVVYRNGERHIEAVEPCYLQPTPPRLKQSGVYFISGGLSGLGLATAKWLAQKYQARLILVSRNADSRAQSLATDLDEMRNVGAELMVRSADVADESALREILAEARGRFGAIDGVIHAAGVLDDGIIQLKSPKRAMSVLSPKIEGALAVLANVADDHPDFIALFSSISSIVPAAGQVDYCAANAYLNALPQSFPESRNIFSIAWGPWAETGMAARAASGLAVRVDHPLIETMERQSAARTIYRGSLSQGRDWILREHRFHGGDALLPGVAYLELAVTAHLKRGGRWPIVLEDVTFIAPFRVSKTTIQPFQLELRSEDSTAQFTLLGEHAAFATGIVKSEVLTPAKIDLNAVARRCRSVLDSPNNVRQNGHFDFGPHWDCLRRIALGEGECLAQLDLAAFGDETSQFKLHPALLDMATGAAFFLIPGYDSPGELMMPFSYTRLVVHAPLEARVWSHVRVRPNGLSEIALFDLTIAGEDGTVLMEVNEFAVKRLNSQAALDAHTSPTLASPGPRRNGPPDRTRILTQEGLEAFDRLVNSRPVGAVFVSPQAPELLKKSMLSVVPAPVESEASGHNIEADLLALWQRLLGVETNDLDGDFFELGGHSLIAVRLFAEIRKRFGVDLGLSTLFEARTIRALAERVRTNIKTANSRRPANCPDLVPIRSGGSKPAIHFFHGVGGSILNYEPLARNLDLDQPVWGVQAAGLRGVEPDISVEQMAARYAAEIREIQPRGPYLLGGQSFGGLIAFEVARQLTAAGHEVGLVALIDTFQKGLPDVPWWRRARFKAAHVSTRAFGHLRRVAFSKNRLSYIRARGRTMRRKISNAAYRHTFRLLRQTGQEIPKALQSVQQANWAAGYNYTPGSYSGHVVLFRCTERSLGDHPDYRMGWAEIVRGNVDVFEIPGNHLTMMNEPGAGIMAERITDYLRQRVQQQFPLEELSESVPREDSYDYTRR